MWTKETPASSNVYDVGYDEEKQELYVTWRKSQKKSIYSGVPEELADQVSKAPSVTNMLNSEIKPNYPHRYA